jgi:ribonuclease J
MELGGTCVEIESQGKRIVLDVGLPLDVPDPESFPLHPIKGFDARDPGLLGVVISHPHQDHYGLAHRLPKETPFLIGKAAEAILASADVFSPTGLRLETALHLEDRRPITLGPFTITPYLVDHSAYDAYAVLIEADGARLFYTGDLRAHGRKGKLFEKLLRVPPEHIDVLLMEGTSLGRIDAVSGCPTEAELEDQFVRLFKQTPGMPLVCCSGQNIDRIVTIFRACKKAGRQFIIDMYTAHVLRATGNEHLPQAGWGEIKVFLPKSQKWQIMRKKEFQLADSYKASRIYPEQLPNEASRSVMLFRPSMMRDIEEAGCLSGSRLIYSVWTGYLKNEKNKQLLDWLRQHGIPLDECHTSGHAAVRDLVKLRNTFSNAVLVPIHTDQPGRFGEVFGNVQRHDDGEWWSVHSSIETRSHCDELHILE